jgi:hypothetical protein
MRDTVPKSNLYFGSEIWVMREKVRPCIFCFFNALVNNIASNATQFARLVIEGRHTAVYHCLE